MKERTCKQCLERKQASDLIEMLNYKFYFYLFQFQNVFIFLHLIDFVLFLYWLNRLKVKLIIKKCSSDFNNNNFSSYNGCFNQKFILFNFWFLLQKYFDWNRPVIFGVKLIIEIFYFSCNIWSKINNWNILFFLSSFKGKLI